MRIAPNICSSLILFRKTNSDIKKLTSPAIIEGYHHVPSLSPPLKRPRTCYYKSTTAPAMAPTKATKLAASCPEAPAVYGAEGCAAAYEALALGWAAPVL